MNLLFEDFKKTNWDKMPFSRKWAEDVFVDKVGAPRGYLKIQAFDHESQMGSGSNMPITLIISFFINNELLATQSTK